MLRLLHALSIGILRDVVLPEYDVRGRNITRRAIRFVSLDTLSRNRKDTRARARVHFSVEFFENSHAFIGNRSLGRKISEYKKFHSFR